MLWDDFLNSVHHDWRGDGAVEDRLDDPDWLRKWLKQQQFDLGLPNSNELSNLKQLRELMHRIVMVLVSAVSPSAEDIQALNKVLADGPVIRQIATTDVHYRVTLSPTGHQWPNVMAEIAASFAQMLADGEPSRIRICDNPNCLWVYYDDTRNRSKRYCDDKMCGNLMKVRRFRARKKAEAAMPPSEH
ncbi:CGNR zinc finger domain-containing protein [Cohnella silvisoli]|uniref:CGNR zinc finger domain-containing protein n=1 Tax=Cohnella silvisoli TaxID=2873699 RepID=A0ABV1L186_9BACL|nr:ABATE domain-containing protein [Cohnella silvisoli]MCD9025492.1 CGNR zinc finger domain-containing protein [Cohnella silvisoli]